MFLRYALVCDFILLQRHGGLQRLTQNQTRLLRQENLVRKWIAVCAGTMLLVTNEPLRAGQSASNAATAPASPARLQTETDEYTRYELLNPESASFRIRYEVTATAA